MLYKTETASKETMQSRLYHFGQRNLTWVKIVVAILYLVGIFGMAMDETRPYFQMLTPFHLLMTAGVMLWFHKEWNRNFIIFVGLAWLLGYGSEVMGVHTGFPFGNYNYGPVLGLQIFEVPLMIGVNWLILVYLTGAVLAGKIANDWIAAALGAVLMVIIDFAIEPVAIALDFWSWEGGIIPLSNYIGWLGVAFIIHMIYRKLAFEKDNHVSLFLLANMTAFFVVLNFVL